MKLPSYRHKLHLVVVKEFGMEPMMLLTSCTVYLGQSIKLQMLVEKIYLVSKRFFRIPSFFNYAIADGIYNLLYPNKTALRGIRQDHFDDFQLCFDFG